MNKTFDEWMTEFKKTPEWQDDSFCWDDMAKSAFGAGMKIEREECAKVCEQQDKEGEGPDCWGWHSKDYARAIRSRVAE